MNLLNTQPALESIYIRHDSGMSSFSEIEKLLKYGCNLKKFTYSGDTLNGDLSSYESLLKIVQNRVFIRFSVSIVTNDILTETFLDVNRKYITFDYIKGVFFRPSELFF